jgi:hypothetical protein
VYEDSELCVLVLLRHFEASQCFPVGAERAAYGLCINGAKTCGADFVVLGDGGLPFAIDFCGGFDAASGSERVGTLCERLKGREDKQECEERRRFHQHSVNTATRDRRELVRGRARY